MDGEQCMFRYYNPNPNGSNIGDCVVRALSKALNQSWDETYLDLMELGFEIKDMPSSNYVWGIYLKRRGFRKTTIEDACPDCYTVKHFCFDYKYGTYVLATGSHVITVINGDYYDSWDSGNEIPIYFFVKE